MATARKTQRTPTLDLALQGGGSHGAFTWGVLDHLLEDESIGISGISGTSAGALNAGVLATGLARGGRAGAREALAAFWEDVSADGACFGTASGFMPKLGLAGFNLDQNPMYTWFNEVAHAFSPYQLNPYDLNALRNVVSRHVDEAALRRASPALFIAATSVRTGQPRIFTAKDLSIEALLASACLPRLFRAVQIDGQPYWDGGYSGNPALWPLIYNTPSLDLMLVKIDPLVRPGTPDTAEEIADRINEITFNAGLVGEMRAIDFVRRLVAEGRVESGRYKNLRLHMISDEKSLSQLHPSSKLNTDWRFLQALHELGQASARRWLHRHRDDLGRRSTLDIEKTFLAPRDIAAP